MEAEAKAGPQGIWKIKKKKQKAEESESEEENGSESEEEESEEEGEVDPGRLRLYERSKLRWYYAIIDCDSPPTANCIYEECDGMEFMKTACKFDLRFVPDAQSFSDRTQRDAAVEVPADYQPPPAFQTKALQHTNVQLTWDKGDEGRKRVLSKKVSADDIKEDDFRAYLASSGSEDDVRTNGTDDSGDDNGQDGEDAHENIRQRYRKLLLLGDEGVDVDGTTHKNNKNKNDSNSSGDEDKKMEMQVTFTSGLETLGDRLVSKHKEAKAAAAGGGATVWEAYMKRKKEKKEEARRLGKKVHMEDDDDDDESDFSDISQSHGSDSDGDEKETDPFFQHEGNPFDDPFFANEGNVTGTAKATSSSMSKKDKNEKNAKNNNKGGEGEGGEETEKRKKDAALEMLLMDERSLLHAHRGAMTKKGTDGTGGTANEGKAKVSKKERMRLNKEKKRRERAGGSDAEDHEEAVGAGFAVNLDDPRFQDLYSAPEFAIDPTDPRYAKAGPGMAVVATEVVKRKNKKLLVGERRRIGGGGGGGGNEDSKKEKDGNGRGGGRKNEVAADLKLMVASLKRKSAQMGSGGGGHEVRGKKVKGSRK